MRPFTFIALLALSVALYIQHQTSAEAPKLADAASAKESTPANKPKPEEVLRRMSDYLVSLPAFSCRLEATFEVKGEKEEANREVTKMTARLQRPNKLALIVDEGRMGITIVSDGKQLTQYMSMLKRYATNSAPADLASMTDVGVPLKFFVLGSTGSLIPDGGDAYFKLLTANVKSSQYIGTEKIDGTESHHLRFVEKRFDWDIWIADGKEPVVKKVLVDMSKQFVDEKATVQYTVAFSDWNVAPKFTDADFAFKAPAGAEQADSLIEPEPPHPLIGQPAPSFKTTDVNGHPFDLKSHLGKNVILLDFWATSCGPCIMLMPELEELAKKYADRGLIYRAVNGGEDAETIKAFLEATKIKAPIVMDPTTQISRDYRVEGIPQTVLIGKDGKVHIVNQGYSEALAGELSKDIEALLDGKDLAAQALGKTKKASQPAK